MLSMTVVTMMAVLPLLATSPPQATPSRDASAAEAQRDYAMSLDANVTIGITPHNPPIIIPKAGGNFAYAIEATNGGATPVVFDVWTTYTLPNGDTFGPVFGPARFALPDGWSASRDNLSAFLPGGMPPGEYTYTAYAGMYPGLIWDSDSFTFEKLSRTGWYPQSPGVDDRLLGIDFPDAKTGWAVGNRWAIQHTTDGGDTWYAQDYGQPYPHAFYDVCFADTQTGWVVGGIILHTTDAGQSWVEQESAYGYALYGVSFVDTETGWAVGGLVDEFGGNERRVIEHTTDGGASWHGQLLQFSHFPLNAVHFADSNNGGAVGPLGAILHTSDGGNTWVEQTSGTNQDLNSVYFVDAVNGWCVGENGTVLHTTDGGANWQAQNPGTSAQLQGVYFTDADTGWIAGADFARSRPIILHTTDGGETWYAQDTGTGNAEVYLYDICFTDAHHGWASGALWPPAGAMLHTDTGGE